LILFFVLPETHTVARPWVINLLSRRQAVQERYNFLSWDSLTGAVTGHVAKLDAPD
jgi:transcriptional regulator of nitric oxide reductase